LEGQLALYRGEHGVRPPVNPDSPADPLPSAVTLLSQLSHARKELAHLEAMVVDLNDKVEWVNRNYPSLLDREHGQFKIITLPQNPSHARMESKKDKDMEKAKQELQVQTLRVQELEAELERVRSAGGGAGGSAFASSLTSSPSSTPSSAALLALQTRHADALSKAESERASAEKKALRLKEVFGAKVLEFRAICYALTGFKIELVQGLYRLKSMYAEREVDHLLFRPTNPAAEGGATGAADKVQTLEVMETDFTARLDPSVTAYLNKMHSIPAFLAAVQLHLLEKQTKAPLR
jgi:hypothetical protein